MVRPCTIATCVWPTKPIALIYGKDLSDFSISRLEWVYFYIEFTDNLDASVLSSILITDITIARVASPIQGAVVQLRMYTCMCVQQIINQATWSRARGRQLHLQPVPRRRRTRLERKTLRSIAWRCGAVLPYFNKTEPGKRYINYSTVTWTPANITFAIGSVWSGNVHSAS